MQTAPSVTCIKCGYDLRGTETDSRCPECGTLVSVSIEQSELRCKHSKQLALRRLFVVVLTATIAAILATGYVHVEEAWMCLDCGKVEVRHIHKLRIPIVDIRLGGIHGRVEQRNYMQPLVDILDPENNCQHQWCRFSVSWKSLMSEFRGGPNAAALGAAADPDDFDDFIRSSPHVVQRLPDAIRKSLYEHTNAVRKLLVDEYCDWLLREKNQECLFDRTR